ncbi:MAG: hypothetical protein RLZZ450_7492 [Pseudomonadota bacterium]|jgi:hypothetical protein
MQTVCALQTPLTMQEERLFFGSEQPDEIVYVVVTI